MEAAVDTFEGLDQMEVTNSEAAVERQELHKEEANVDNIGSLEDRVESGKS